VERENSISLVTILSLFLSTYVITGVSVTILAEKTGSDTTFGANKEISWMQSRYSAFTSITTKFFACFMGVYSSVLFPVSLAIVVGGKVLRTLKFFPKWV
jgi:hypothetical protein